MNVSDGILITPIAETNDCALFGTIFQRVLREVESRTKTRLTNQNSGMLREERITLEQSLLEECEYLFRTATQAEVKGSDPERMLKVYSSIAAIISASLLIGSQGAISEEAMSFLRKAALANQATLAQQANSDRAAARRDKLRAAIYQAAKGQPLVGTDKFAGSIRKAVIGYAGVDSTTRGFSKTTIQREIRAILEERGNS